MQTQRTKFLRHKISLFSMLDNRFKDTAYKQKSETNQKLYIAALATNFS